MKNILSILLLFCFLSEVSAQDISQKVEVSGVEKRKIGFHSIAFSPLSFYSSNRDGGVALDIELGFNYGLNVIKLYAASGSEFTVSVFGASVTDSYTEASILYGRELKAGEFFFVDFFAGIGYFAFTYDGGAIADDTFNYYTNSFDTVGEYKKTVLGIPLDLKFRFQTGPLFSLGLQIHGNINSATSIVQPGLFLQWKL